MGASVTLLLAVLALLPGQTHHPQADVATAQRIQQREEFLRQEMSRLWQEIEQRALEKAFFHSMFNWLFWAAVAAVLIEFCVQKQLGSSSCPEQDSYSHKEEEDDSEEDDDLNGAQNAARSLAWPTLFPVQELPGLGRNLKQLLGDFLISQEFSQSTLMPKISPHSGMNGTHESWKIHKN